MASVFKDKSTEALYRGEYVRQFDGIEKVACRKLDMVCNAVALDDLRVPPRNHLEMLKGDRRGQHSIRINDHWRVCFVWTDGGAQQIEIVDYH